MGKDRKQKYMRIYVIVLESVYGYIYIYISDLFKKKIALNVRFFFFKKNILLVSEFLYILGPQ